MDSTVKPVIALLLACSAAWATAQTAGDPTLPPPSMLPPGSAGATSAPAGPELQSILVSREPGGRRVAVISGEMVKQGSRVNGAVVESVRDNEVVLRRGKAREVLKLYPKKPADQ